MKKIQPIYMAIAVVAILMLAGCRPATVTNPTTGKTWMDRNLGASQVATGSTDAAAYGDLYQWGRASDGHESRTSGTTITNATTAMPGGGNSWDGLFIMSRDPMDLSSLESDWLTTPDNTLWEGVHGRNNPCPEGFRLPTDEEWEEERLSWKTNDAAGAFGSPLKLTLAGVRNYGDGGLVSHTVSHGIYWSSSHRDTPSARILFLQPDNAAMGLTSRANGYSVRCIKD